MLVICTILGSWLGVLVAGASVVAGFSWLVAGLAYLGFSVLGMCSGIILTLRRKGEKDC